MTLLTPTAAIPYPELTDIPNAQSAFQALALALDTKVIPRFATAAARSVAITSPVAGMVTYRADAAAPGFEYWNGSAWTGLVANGQPTLTAVQGSDLSVATTTLTNSGLTFGTEPSKKYITEWTLFYAADAAADAQIDFTGPSGFSYRGMFQSVPSDATDPVSNVYMGSTTAASGVTLGGRGTGTPLAAMLRVTFDSGAGGNIRLRFAKRTLTGGDSVLYALSSVTAVRD